MGSNLADDGFLRVIQIHSKTSFQGEVKPLVPCSKVSQHAKAVKPYNTGRLYIILKGYFWD
jgi:hypothetical protein